MAQFSEDSFKDIHSYFEEEEEEEIPIKTPAIRRARKIVLLRACFGEAIGTALLVWLRWSIYLNMSRSGLSTKYFNITLALTYGFIMAGISNSLGDVSGAHFNPAITFSTWLARKTSNRKMVLYLCGQVAGMFAGLGFLAGCFPDPANELKEFLSIEPTEESGVIRAYSTVLFCALVLSFVMFATAFDTVDTESKSHRRGVHTHNLTLYFASVSSKAGFAPLAISAIVGVLAFYAQPMPGGEMVNPLLSLVPCLVGSSCDSQWVYWVASFTGAGLGGLLQLLFSQHHDLKTSYDPHPNLTHEMRSRVEENPALTKRQTAEE